MEIMTAGYRREGTKDPLRGLRQGDRLRLTDDDELLVLDGEGHRLELVATDGEPCVEDFSHLDDIGADFTHFVQGLVAAAGLDFVVDQRGIDDGFRAAFELLARRESAPEAERKTSTLRNRVFTPSWQQNTG